MSGKTRNVDQLCQRVATSMNLLRPGEALSARFASQFRETYEELHSELVDDKIAYWPLDEIPLSVFQRVAWLVALNVAPSLGVMPVLLNAMNEASAEIARDTVREHLRRHVAKDAHFETLPMDNI